MNKYIGIDISKQTFDVYGEAHDGQQEYSLHEQGSKEYKKLIKKYGKDKTYVMEATGPYYLQLAMFLFKNDIGVAVVNPLIIKRYSQMNLQRAKTDKKDAKTIHDYASDIGVKLWSPPPNEIFQIEQTMTSLDLLNKQKTATSNQLKAFQISGVLVPALSRSLKGIIAKFEKEIKKLEAQTEEIINAHFAKTRDLIVSIPGLGIKAVAVLIATTHNFTRFANYKQIIAFVGFSPRVYESGTSVKGKGHICKMGKGKVRKQMYLSAWSAKFHNKSCMELYERLSAKGKPERVIKVAIANKLIKQVFAVVTKNKAYDENHVSVLAIAKP